jgi:hypothetical protein
MPEDWPYCYPNFNEACRFIAKCYLLRSRLALPKGSDIPEKKIEAINLAWEWAKKIHDNPLDRLKTEIALERSRWNKNLPINWLTEKLSDFSLPDHLDEWGLVDFAAYDKGRELGLSHFPDRDAYICGHFSKNENPYFIFYQTKAAYRNRAEKLSCLLRALIDKLDGIPLSFPLWEDTVDLLYRIKNDGQDVWTDAAIAAWRACQKEEGKLKHSLQVRWYWSRWAALYDLAFLAAYEKNDPLLAAEVADSLKSRPVTKLPLMEKTMSAHDREILEAAWEIETNFAAGNFQAGYNRAATAKQTSDGPDTIDFKVAKKGWSVIHLYLSKNQTVYAVVFNDDDSSSVTELGKITKTWEHYQDWKTVLMKNNGLSDTNDALKKLCESCGKMLEKAFQKIKNENDLLFIPHGFLHLVPLHASFIDGQPLFMTRKCLFLPAWSLYSRENQGIRSNGSLLLTNWTQPTHLTHFIDHPLWSNCKKSFCTPDDCVSSLTGCKDDFSWQLIVFYCHGQANFSNPYQSALKMSGGPLTHKAIAQLADPGFTGAQVILTACETDVVYDGASESDEHLSLAAAFLQKKAVAVCGTLFKSPPDISSEIISAAANNPAQPLHDILLTIQRDNYESPDDLYRLAPYRVMGKF